MERMGYGDVDLNLLLVLERLLARRSVTEAAADLGLSQPATSRALQRLREALGDPLLVRAGRDMVPTERARDLQGPVVEAVAAAGRVFAPPPTFQPTTAEGSFTLGLGDEAQEAFTPALYARLRAVAPGIDLRIRSLGPDSIDQGRRGLLDLALSPDLSALPAIAGGPDLSELVHRRVYTRRFVVIGARRAWPERPDLATWLAADHGIVSFEGGGEGFVDALLARTGQRRRVAASVTSFPALARLVADSALLAVVPGEVVAAAPDALVAWPCPVDLPDLPMLLLWHPRQTTQGRHRFLRDLVAEVVVEALEDLGPTVSPPGGSASAPPAPSAG